MTIVLYNLFLVFYRAGISITSLWNKKAQQWLEGRKKIFEQLKSKIFLQQFQGQKSKLVWFHCSSLGEFEQGRPVLEKLKSLYPDSRFLLTFFSPSGFEVKKDYKEADWVFYLPIDSPSNAKNFLDLVNPSLVVFVKYDYWYYYLTACKKRNIPLLMISAIFRKEKPFFKWYGALHRKMLSCFTCFFVQDIESKDLLHSVNINNVVVAGDSRFDRVIEIAEKFQPVGVIEKFCEDSKVIVAGSTWPEDEKLIKEATESIPELKLIIAPHEIHESHIQELKNLFPDSVFFSELETINDKPAFAKASAGKLKTIKVLIIDNIGMLSRLYKYATITYVGGGFTNGIHNTLEAAVYGKPVIFGPKYKKFREAVELLQSGGGAYITGFGEMKDRVLKLLADNNFYKTTCEASLNYVKKNKGATGKILHYIQENRLLTN